MHGGRVPAVFPDLSGPGGLKEAIWNLPVTIPMF